MCTVQSHDLCVHSTATEIRSPLRCIPRLEFQLQRIRRPCAALRVILCTSLGCHGYGASDTYTFDALQQIKTANAEYVFV